LAIFANTGDRVLGDLYQGISGHAGPDKVLKLDDVAQAGKLLG